MKIGKTLVILAIVINVIGLTADLAVSTEALPGDVVVSPLSPTALSTITLSTTLGGDAPSEVRVTVEECNGNTGICYPDIQNVSMSRISSGKYQTQVTLKHSDATYITCQIIAKNDGAWISYSKKNVNLSENPNGNNGDGNIIPGFEVVLFVVAIGVSLIVLGRKRVK